MSYLLHTPQLSPKFLEGWVSTRDQFSVFEEKVEEGRREKRDGTVLNPPSCDILGE